MASTVPFKWMIDKKFFMGVREEETRALTTVTTELKAALS